MQFEEQWNAYNAAISAGEKAERSWVDSPDVATRRAYFDALKVVVEIGTDFHELLTTMKDQHGPQMPDEARADLENLAWRISEMVKNSLGRMEQLVKDDEAGTAGDSSD